jgi:hypothetical protein
MNHNYKYKFEFENGFKIYSNTAKGLADKYFANYDKCNNVCYRTFEFNENIKRYQMMYYKVFDEFCVWYDKYNKIREKLDRIENDF